jgi:hypothetical protein
MTSRLASISLASLLLCTACPSDDEGGTTDEAGTGTESETGTGTDTETGTDTGTETGAACAVGEMCCAELEECVTTQDCCEPDVYTCALEGPTYKCVDLVAMCQNCLMNCEGMAPPDVCAMSCAIWCNPP